MVALKALKTDKVKFTGWLWGSTVVMGVYSGWNSFLLKYGGEVFPDKVSFV